MIETIKTFLKTNHIDPHARFIIAVSGGADSIALLHAFKYLNADILALHCNFALRGKESDMDEQFVKRFCTTYGIPHSVKRFDTAATARERGVSLEMAARELRYAWFEEIRQQKRRDYIVLGHHADDQAETLLLNLCRGTGIKGLTGMRPVNGQLLRPLLDRSRGEILDYIKSNQLGFRTDSTNESLDYTRNKLRHRVLPVLKEINPSFLRTTRETIHILGEVESVYRHGIEQLKRKITVEEEGELLIHIRKLMASPAPYSLLFEIVRPYGFNATQVRDILDSHTAIPGKQFQAGEYLLTRGRTYWRLFNVLEGDSTPALLADAGEYRVGPLLFRLHEQEIDDSFTIPTARHIACFNRDKLIYPLVARHWRAGDRFCPLGMKWSKKKLSDFFIDQKFSAKQKKECLILQSGDDIIWVVGHRIDDRYKITSTTRRALLITVERP
ncbi:MAG: tRNA lysidine(34) synthetase TilS [Odoribacteraceae bacterium]|jgi:tRNA(Ile)-lysidine synthase|nr:tRNA lysidine(34) synthetase TilS [Odoribacteraceae bacterium]